MAHETIHLHGLLDVPFQDEEVPSLLESLLSVTNPPKNDAGRPTYRYRVGGDGPQRHGRTSDRSTVERLLAENGAGRLRGLVYRDVTVDLAVNDPEVAAPDPPAYTLAVSPAGNGHPSGGGSAPPEDPEWFVSQVADLAVDVHTGIDPLLTYGTHPTRSGDLAAHPSRSDAREGQFGRLHWLSILSPTAVENLGGWDRVLSAPAHETRALSDGSVLVVAAPTPGEDPTEAVRRHLQLR